jgi:hypothetical protein
MNTDLEKPGKLSLYIFEDNEDVVNELRREFTPLAKKYAQHLKIAIADFVEFKPMAEGFGLKQNRRPAVALHAPMNDNVFLYEQGRSFSASTIERMLLEVLNGRAVNGQVFGEDIDEGDEGATKTEFVSAGEDRGHDEL